MRGKLPQGDIMAYQVDTGVKIPASKYGTGTGKYPWHQLNSGDSFFVPEHELANPKSRPATPLFKTSSRVCVESGIKGIRVWKI